MKEILTPQGLQKKSETRWVIVIPLSARVCVDKGTTCILRKYAAWRWRTGA
jgi:hypothetical protein